MAYFGHPVGTTVLEPVPSELVRKAGESVERKKVGDGKQLTADDHLMSRLKASYLGMYQDEDGQDNK